MFENGKISNPMQIASVKRYTVTDGVMRGLQVLEADNGRLRFLLNESKSLDIMQLFDRGENLSFLSKNAFTVRETAFEKRYEGGMLYTCGLDALGRLEGHEMHGGLHNLPAQILTAKRGGEEILIEAEMRDCALFGKNLLLRRRIRTRIGGSALILEDELVNEGDSEADYCILYHINLGYPFLDEDTHVEWDAAEVIPRDWFAEENLGECKKITAPECGKEENCYYVRLNRPAVSVVSERAAKRFSLAYSGDTLPYFIEWKSMRCGDYALGLEPCTSLLDERFAYSRIGRGEKIKFRLEMSVEDIAGGGR